VVLTRFQGLFAAVVTPIHEDGRLDLPTFDRLVEFLVAAGVDGICITGATGEYPHVETADRLALIGRAAGRLPRDRTLLVGIGAPNPRRVVELGAASFEAGSRAGRSARLRFAGEPRRARSVPVVRPPGLYERPCVRDRTRAAA
jgi:dihydrodipicolinate synthase/N-acetylneuraminate lyase